MKPVATAAAVVALALLTFFQFPGHTWLQQDSQIYAPVLEHLRDDSVLRNDMLAQQSQVAYTLYDETALGLRRVTGLSFRAVLALEQVTARALGIWGLYLMAAAMGLAAGPALAVAGICSLGALIAGPQVLTIEYEPTPRAFAVPLVMCALGLAAHRRYRDAGIAAAIAFLYHAPTALPFWGLFAALAIARRRWWGLAPLAAALGILWLAARIQGGAAAEQPFFAALAPSDEQIQRMRAAYVWISSWPPLLVVHWIVLLVIFLAAWARLRREMPVELRLLLLGLSILGVAAMPASGLLLERWRWALIPQLQPMRTLLFVALGMQFLTAVAGVRAAVRGRPAEAMAWLAMAYLLPLQAVITGPFVGSRIALAAALAAFTAVVVWSRPRFAPLAAVVAFFAIPTLGGVVNYPRLHTPELEQLSEWARSNTPQDAVFIFPDAGRALSPGVFRSAALRAVYVDWKGGGQVNYLRGFGERWWFRWQQTMARGFRAADLAKYDGLGIGYVVLQPANRLDRVAAFENSRYLVYRVR